MGVETSRAYLSSVLSFRACIRALELGVCPGPGVAPAAVYLLFASPGPGPALSHRERAELGAAASTSSVIDCECRHQRDRDTAPRPGQSRPGSRAHCSGQLLSDRHNNIKLCSVLLPAVS